VLLGSLLGDGSLCQRGRFPERRLPWFQEGHSIKQLAYLEWKQRALANLGAEIGEPRAVATAAGRPKEHLTVRLRTRPLPCLWPFLSLCRPDGHKRITWDWLSRVGPLGLAVWFMDDGCINVRKNRNPRLMLTCSPASDEELALYRRYFMEVWGTAAPHMQSAGGQGHRRNRAWVLTFTVGDSNRLFDAMRPYLQLGSEKPWKRWVAAECPLGEADGVVPVPVYSVERIRKRAMAYDLTVEPQHTFIANWAVSSNCYPLVKQDGKLSLRRYKLNVGAPSSDLLTLTHNNIRSWQWVAGYSRIINQIIFDYDWGLTGAKGVYGMREIFTQTASKNKYGLRPPLVIQSRGILTSAGGAAIALSRATEVARRFAEPPQMLAISAFYQKHPLEAGDQVAVTSSLIPNPSTGLRGMTSEVFEVLDVRPNFGPQGGVDLALLWVGNLPVVAAPTSGGATDTPPPDAVIPEITVENLDLHLGVETGGMVVGLDATFTASTPKSAYRLFTSSTMENDYAVATGDIIRYDIRFNAASVDTRGGLDIAFTERAGTVGTGSNDATHVKLDAGASAVNDFYNGMVIQLAVGANPLQYRTVIDYVGSTKVAQVATWTNNPVDATSTFVVAQTLRNLNLLDQNSLGASPATQLGAPALDTWYTRTFTIPSSLNGKTIISAAVGIDTAASGASTFGLRGPHILSAAGLLKTNLFRHGYAGDATIWVWGPGGLADQNPSGTPAAFRLTGGTAQPTENVMNLAVSRGDQVEITTEAAATTTEAVVATITPFFGGIQDRVRVTGCLVVGLQVTANTKGSDGGVSCRVRMRKDNVSGTIMDTKVMAWIPALGQLNEIIAGTVALQGLDSPALANTTRNYVLTVQKILGTNITAAANWDELKLGALVSSA
jgi:hypothetical protein